MKRLYFAEYFNAAGEAVDLTMGAASARGMVRHARAVAGRQAYAGFKLLTKAAGDIVEPTITETHTCTRSIESVQGQFPRVVSRWGITRS